MEADDSNQLDSQSTSCVNPCEVSIGGVFEEHTIVATVDNNFDIIKFFGQNHTSVINIVQDALHRKEGIKFFVCCHVTFVKINPLTEEEVYTNAYFRSFCEIAVSDLDVHHDLIVSYQKILAGISQFSREGSDWRFFSVNEMFVNIAQYVPISASGYIKLPKQLSTKKAIVNIQNKDDRCFIWCILAALFPVGQNARRVSNYRPYLKTLNVQGLTYPVSIGQIPLFEKNNSVSINVFIYKNNHVVLLYLTKLRYGRHINLLIITDGPNTHYTLIRSMSRLFSANINTNSSTYICNYCLAQFIAENSFKKHSENCQQDKIQTIVMPKEEDKYVYFKTIEKKFICPFFLTIDFESYLRPLSTVIPNPHAPSTTTLQLHEPSSYCIVIASPFKEYHQPPIIYRGPDVIDHFYDTLDKIEKWLIPILKHIVPPDLSTLSPDAKQDFCHICEGKIAESEISVLDHCHITGKCNGYAHNSCNLNYRITTKIPCVLHNLQMYDGKLLLKGLRNPSGRKLKCIPKSRESFLSFSWGSFVFIDSARFLMSSLNNLATVLLNSGKCHFKYLQKFIPPDVIDLCLSKAPYPYSYITDSSKFLETKLPPIEAFYNDLNRTAITPEEYERAQKIWRGFKCKTLGDFADIYVLMDTLILQDVFCKFRKDIYRSFSLDVCNYYSLPRLSFEACLKMTKATVELITDREMYDFVHDSIRGGLCLVPGRYFKINHPSQPDYDCYKPVQTAYSTDFNNLYGWAMKQPLPTGEFKWLTEEQLATFDINTIDLDREVGFFIECDLYIPDALHDTFNDLPPCPTKIELTEDQLSPWLLEDLSKANTKFKNVSKLVPTLLPKLGYIVHAKTLQTYLSIGVTLLKITRVLKFRQSNFLEKYVDFNTKNRAKSTSIWESNINKMLNNAVYGFFLLNLMGRINVKLCQDPKEMLKLVAKQTFQSFKFINSNLISVNMTRSRVLLNNALFVGASILELSKELLYRVYYKNIKPYFKESVSLLLLDTDSYILKFTDADFLKFVENNKDLFDLSNFPPTHYLYSDTNKKKPGYLKIESADKPVLSFIGLRPKLYTIIIGDKLEKKAKGVSRASIQQDLTYQSYYNSLFQQHITYTSSSRIQGKSHQLYTLFCIKKSLTSFDDKRYHLTYQQDISFAYGHYLLKYLEEIWQRLGVLK